MAASERPSEQKLETKPLVPLNLTFSPEFTDATQYFTSNRSIMLSNGIFVGYVNDVREFQVIDFLNNTRRKIQLPDENHQTLCLYKVSEFCYAVTSKTKNSSQLFFSVFEQLNQTPTYCSPFPKEVDKVNVTIQLCPQKNHIALLHSDKGFFLGDLERNKWEKIKASYFNYDLYPKACFLANGDIAIAYPKVLRILSVDFNSLKTTIKQDYPLVVNHFDDITFSPVSPAYFILQFRSTPYSISEVVVRIHDSKLKVISNEMRCSRFYFLSDGTLLGLQHDKTFSRMIIQQKELEKVDNFTGDATAQKTLVSPDGCLIQFSRASGIHVYTDLQIKKTHSCSAIEYRKKRDLVQLCTTFPPAIASIVAAYASGQDELSSLPICFSVPIRDDLDEKLSRELENLHKKLELEVLRELKDTSLTTKFFSPKKFAQRREESLLEKMALEFFVSLLKKESNEKISFSECLEIATKQFPAEMGRILLLLGLSERFCHSESFGHSEIFGHSERSEESSRTFRNVR